MPLSWNEIRHRAIAFSKEWTGAKSERAEKQTFWNEFFNVFGMSRRAVASFEQPVKGISGRYGYIDLFWPGMALVEHKSFGNDLGKAESQAFRYIHDLVSEGRAEDVPCYVIVSDFARIALHDLEPEDQRHLPLFDRWHVATVEFPLADLYSNIHHFAFIPGYKQHKFEEQDPINISRRLRSWAAFTTRLKGRVTKGISLSASSYAFSFASLRRTPASLSVKPSRSIWRTALPGTAQTLACTSRACSMC